jgi:hypothetical protein
MDQDDDHFNRLLIRHKVIRSVVGLLHDTKGKKTPTNWACLEFFEYIRKVTSELYLFFIWLLILIFRPLLFLNRIDEYQIARDAVRHPP